MGEDNMQIRVVWITKKNKNKKPKIKMKKLLKFSNTKKVLSGAMTLTLMAGASTLLAPKAQAAGITNMSLSGTGITSNSSAINTDLVPVFTFQLATALAPSETLTIAAKGMDVDAANALASADLTAGGACSGTITLAGSPISTNTSEPTLALTGLTCTTSGTATITVAANRLDSLGTADNYGITYTTPYDSGAFFYYVGDENDVRVTATVDTALSFQIVQADDTTLPQANVAGGAVGPNLCDMGSITTSTLVTDSQCEYRLRIATNATAYTVTVVADADLNTVSGDTIDAIAEGGTVTMGTEGYGVLVNAGSATGGAITEEGDFNDDDTPMPTSPTLLYSSDGPNYKYCFGNSPSCYLCINCCWTV
jgi:hypothetical protein